MQTVLAESQRYGIEQVELQVYQHNEAAIALYQSAGFAMMPESNEETLPSGSKVISRKMGLTIEPAFG